MQPIRAVLMPDPAGGVSRRDLLLHSALAVLIAVGGYSVGLQVANRAAESAPLATPPSPEAADADSPLNTESPGWPEAEPESPGPNVDDPIAAEPELGSSFNPDDFLHTWAACSAVTVRLDATIPDALAFLVQDEARTILELAGLEVVEGGRVDLNLRDDPDRIRSVGVGELAIGLNGQGQLGDLAIGQASGATMDGHLVSSLVVVDESLVGTEQFLPVLRHELGHAVGLPHSDDRGQLMFPSLVPGAPGSFQLPEMAALAQISERPCEVPS